MGLWTGAGMEFPGWKEPGYGTPERPGVPNQRGTEIEEIILFDKAQTGAPRASPDSVIG